MTSSVGIYGVFQPSGACELSVSAKTTRTNPETISAAPAQSILMPFFLFSAESEDIAKYDMTVVTAVNAAPIQKYQPQCKNWPTKPEKKMPKKNPITAQVPYKLKTRFFLGPGLYTPPKSITPVGRYAAAPRPCSALQKSSISGLIEKPAIRDQTVSQARPEM